MTNQYQANSREHAWLKLVATKSTWTLSSIPVTVRLLQSMPVALGLPGFLSIMSLGNFHKEVMLCHWEHFKLNIMSSRVLSPHYKCPHHFSATCDDKVNDCGFKFSVACKWCVLIEEDKDDSL